MALFCQAATRPGGADPDIGGPDGSQADLSKDATDDWPTPKKPTNMSTS
jgi:hypothetical protein